MKYVSIILISLYLSGCLIYLDYPEEQVVSGTVFLENGEPASGAIVKIWEMRKYISLTPISYPPAAVTETNSNGEFEVKVKNIWPARITADSACGRGESEVTKNNFTSINIKVANKC